MKWWRQPLSKHCLSCSCNDSPFGAAWGGGWTPNTLQGEDSEVPRWFPWENPQEAEGHWVRWEEGRGESEIYLSSHTTGSKRLQCLHHQPPSAGSPQARATLILKPSWLMGRKGLYKGIGPCVFSCLSHLLNPRVRIRQKEQEGSQQGLHLSSFMELAAG